MGTPGESSRSTKSNVDQLLALHRELNPVRGRDVLVALDPGTGQLFFTARKGSCVARDRFAKARAREMGIDAC